MIYDSSIAKELEALITSALKNRLTGQGHITTGKGLNSIETKVIPRGEDLVIQIYGEDYLEYQDSGRKPGKFPNVGALREWVRRKGLATEMKEVNKIAFLIGRNMQRIGMHSTNKRIDLSKRGFITQTIDQFEGRINQDLFRMFEKNFDLIVTRASDEIGGIYKISL